MANSYTEYTASSVTTSTQFATPSYITGRGATDISVTVAGVTQASSAYTLTGTNITFASDSLPTDGAKIRITRSTSQNARINNYSDNTVLTATQLNTDGEQSFMMAQEALDQAAQTEFAAQTFYSSGTSTPSSASTGDLFFNTSTGLLQLYNGNSWESINSRGRKETFTTTGNQTVFTPSHPVDTNTLVFLNGSLKKVGSDYTTTATQVTFGTNVTAGNTVEIVSFPNAVSGFNVPDNTKVTFGAAEDLTIHSDGTHSYITEKNTSGNLFIDSNHLVVRQGTGYPTGDDTTPQDFNRIVATGSTSGGLLFFVGGESSYDSNDSTNYDPLYGRWRNYIRPAVGNSAGGILNYGRLDVKDATGNGIQSSVTIDSGCTDSGMLTVENNCIFATGPNATQIELGGTQNTNPIDIVMKAADIKIEGDIIPNSILSKINIQAHLKPVSETRTTINTLSFRQLGDKRIFYSGAGTSTWSLLDINQNTPANSVHDGDTWVIMNVSDYNIILDRNGMLLKYINGTSVSSGTANRTIGSGGIAELVFDATAGCYYIFGDGIT